jgi:hypothetical protein
MCCVVAIALIENRAERAYSSIEANCWSSEQNVAMFPATLTMSRFADPTVAPSSYRANEILALDAARLTIEAIVPISAMAIISVIELDVLTGSASESNGIDYQIWCNL